MQLIFARGGGGGLDKRGNVDGGGGDGGSVFLSNFRPHKSFRLPSVRFLRRFLFRSDAVFWRLRITLVGKDSEEQGEGEFGGGGRQWMGRSWIRNRRHCDRFLLRASIGGNLHNVWKTNALTFAPDATKLNLKDPGFVAPSLGLSSQSP